MAENINTEFMDTEQLSKETMLHPDFIPAIFKEVTDSDQLNEVLEAILHKAETYRIKGRIQKEITRQSNLKTYEVTNDSIVLELSPNGIPVNNASNFEKILTLDPEFNDLFYYDEFFESIMKSDGSNTEWSDSDDALLRSEINKKYGLYHPNMLYDAIVNIANSKARHPIKEIIESKKWDGKPRIDTFLIDVYGCKDNNYSRQVSRMIFYGGINRLYNPGCKFDYVPILIGEQGCVDADTEYFNGEKWTKISEYKQGDKVLQYNENGTAELVQPLNYIKQPTSGLWHFKTKYGIDQCLSDNHTVVYITSKGNLYSKKFGDIRKRHAEKPFKGEFITAFDYEGKGIDLTDDEIRLMIAVFADGSIAHKRMRFHLKKERKVSRLIKLLNACGIEYYKSYNDEQKYYNITFEPPMLLKHYPNEWYSCSKHQFEVIANEVMFWDGYAEKNNGFTTTNKNDADFIQFVFNSLGYYASIHVDNRVGTNYKNDKYKRKSLAYTVRYSKEYLKTLNHSKENKTKIERYESKDGMEYCFTVPSHMLVLRRNNCVFVTGNCGKSTLVRALSLDDLYFNEINTVDGKEGMEAVSRAWICEMSELTAMFKQSEVGALKAYITKQYDTYRRAYARRVTSSPRKCIIIGTSNEYQFLSDQTGNRRFLPIEVNPDGHEIYKNINKIRKHILKCWQEALYLMKAGKTYLTIPVEYLPEVEQEQQNAVVDDPRTGAIVSYLEQYKIGDKISGMEIFTKALNGIKKNFTTMEGRNISRTMASLEDWERTGQFRTQDFGRQSGWVKIDPSTRTKPPEIKVDNDFSDLD